MSLYSLIKINLFAVRFSNICVDVNVWLAICIDLYRPTISGINKLFTSYIFKFHYFYMLPRKPLLFKCISSFPYNLYIVYAYLVVNTTFAIKFAVLWILLIIIMWHAFRDGLYWLLGNCSFHSIFNHFYSMHLFANCLLLFKIQSFPNCTHTEYGHAFNKYIGYNWSVYIALVLDVSHNMAVCHVRVHDMPYTRTSNVCYSIK